MSKTNEKDSVEQRFIPGQSIRAWKKRERTSKRYYRTRQEARADVVDYIEMFYNSWRKHSYLGYVSPNEYEKIAQAA